MTRFILIALPLAFLVGACDTPETTPNDDAVEVADESAVDSRDGHRGRGGKLARLDADKDGSISSEEAKAHPFLADKFATLDADKDGKLSKDELHAGKGKFGHGKRGHGDGAWKQKTPAEHAAHKLAKYDANGDKALTRDEVEGHRFADKFVEIDADKDGKLTLDEITAYKTANPGGHGKHGGKHGDWKGKEMHGERGDHGGKGWSKDPAERADKLLGKLDANKDSVLTRDELQSSRFADKFAAADSDGDGKITRDELMAFRPARPERADAPAVR